MLAYNANCWQVFPFNRYFCVSTVTMKYNKITANERKRIFEAFEEGQDWRALAKTLPVKLRTAYDWLRNGKMNPKKKGGSISKKTPEMMAVIAEKIKKGPSCTL